MQVSNNSNFISNTTHGDNADFHYNVKTFIVFGVLYELMNALVNPFAVKFLQRVGGGAVDISLYNSMKGLVMIVAVLPGVFLINRVLDKRRITAWLVLFMGLFALMLSAVPLFDSALQPLLFIGISALIMIPQSVYNASYQSFTGELFPQRRAQVIAKRSRYTIIFTTTITLFTGFLFRYVPQNNADFIRLYQILFALAFIVAGLGFMVFLKFRHTPKPNREHLHFKGSFKAVLKHKGYVHFVIASTAFHFGWQMGWPLFSVYMIETLGADELWLAIISVGASTAMFFGLRYWPLVIERLGNMRTTTICTLGMALTPVLYAVSPNLYILAVVSTITGIFTSGTITVLFADMLEVTPSDNRIIYVGYYNTMTNITLAISPFVGLFFLSNFNIYVALIVTALTRLLGSAAFLYREKLHDKYHEGA